MLRVLRFDASGAVPITQFDSVASSAIQLGHGDGECHTYAVRLEPGGEIGFHPAGFGQLFIVVEGRGWVATKETRVDVVAGEAVSIDQGTIHAKGSTDGLVAIMVQMRNLVSAE